MTVQRVEHTFCAEKVRIHVTGHQEDGHLDLAFHIKGGDGYLLHWGLSQRREKAWRRPPESLWPPQSTAFGDNAVETAFAPADDEGGIVHIRLDLSHGWGKLPFVLHGPQENHWLKDRGGDFQVILPRPNGSTPSAALTARTGAGNWRRQSFELGAGDSLAAGVLEDADPIRVMLVTDVDAPLLLHWGVSERFRFQWKAPRPEIRPPGTIDVDEKAVHTPFSERDGLRTLELVFTAPIPRGINFVLYQPQTQAWLKGDSGDMHLLLREARADDSGIPPQLQDLADRILDAEVGKSSWTLMHRFNLCHDLLDSADNDPAALALLFTWLRYSAIRQLDWQRNYNTQPRELAHAQERLTTRVAGLYPKHPGSRPWLRLMLTTLGRGGEGQEVRDEILNIMHRHHIKEMHGHFMEEWHQKLHNNTTPDDIVICEAYLAFLQSNGDLKRFYETLSQGGVSRERLRNFERSIVTDPEFYPDKRDGLSHDFQNFLRILKSVHSGTDLDTAATSVRFALSEALHRKLDELQGQRHQGASAQDRVRTLTELREGLADHLPTTGDAHAVREILYMDLALEQTLRGLIEQQNLSGAPEAYLWALIHLTLRNVRLSAPSEEFDYSERHLARLLQAHRDTVSWALEARSVTERMGRAIAAWSERLYAHLQPKAHYLGEAFGVDAWTIPLFSEEVIRGGPPFALSLLLHRLDPLLRARAGIGGWQVISPAVATGKVRVVESLGAVQGEHYPEATVLVTDAVSGDEEIPEGVTSVITSDAPDLVSHVAVRARNAHVLFASCFDTDAYQRLKALNDHRLAMEVTPSGDVTYQDAPAGQPEPGRAPTLAAPRLRRRAFSTWAVRSAKFNRDMLGGKSNNLTALKGRLADWIHLPASIALPFGVFEKTLEEPQNRALEDRLKAALGQVGEEPALPLAEVRRLIVELHAPETLRASLLDAWTAEELPRVDWEKTWAAIKRVWASKWNERAYFARTARAIAHDDLIMAVLIQRVVEADYAFVIHTVNPLTGNNDELFAEVVLGLGETLVGNYPGRALGFVCHKESLEFELLSYPSKSEGLYGGGVIFRSDSNGEDLEDYAGAGLYDSFLAEAPRTRPLDYSAEPLVQDPGSRAGVLRAVARIAIGVEQACGAPQDIEGALQGNDYYVVQTRPQVGL